ncbi:hypothetical protein FF38_09172 [Lucilia cuprina]|uniref:Uncharacterized protein n=1 Tax=Lucilia cuprina TaxID=7375 RepID=A0A0L0C9L7_LUCCU|nr:hypothetical protein FF38_09172 [Lucilia cuprina]
MTKERTTGPIWTYNCNLVSVPESGGSTPMIKVRLLYSCRSHLYATTFFCGVGLDCGLGGIRALTLFSPDKCVFVVKMKPLIKNKLNIIKLQFSYKLKNVACKVSYDMRAMISQQHPRGQHKFEAVRRFKKGENKRLKAQELYKYYSYKLLLPALIECSYNLC